MLHCRHYRHYTCNGREDDGRTDIEILYDDDAQPHICLNVGDGIWGVTNGRQARIGFSANIN